MQKGQDPSLENAWGSHVCPPYIYMYVDDMSFASDFRHCIRDSTTSVSTWRHTFTMGRYTAFPLLQRLESTLIMSPPYCSGILEAPHEAFKLYYGQKNARCVWTASRLALGSPEH